MKYAISCRARFVLRRVVRIRGGGSPGTNGRHRRTAAAPCLYRQRRTDRSLRIGARRRVVFVGPRAERGRTQGSRVLVRSQRNRIQRSRSGRTILRATERGPARAPHTRRRETALPARRSLPRRTDGAYLREAISVRGGGAGARRLVA